MIELAIIFEAIIIIIILGSIGKIHRQLTDAETTLSYMAEKAQLIDDALENIETLRTELDHSVKDVKQLHSTKKERAKEQKDAEDRKMEEITGKAPSSKARILIVEDHYPQAMCLQGVLETLGHTVTAIAESGKEAIVQAHANSTDLILMDIMIKGDMDGVETAEEIRKDIDIPVIFLTAIDNEETTQRAKKALPYGYLVKPIDENKLRIAIDMAIYRHSLE